MSEIANFVRTILCPIRTTAGPRSTDWELGAKINNRDAYYLIRLRKHIIIAKGRQVHAIYSDYATSFPVTLILNFDKLCINNKCQV